MQNLEKSIKNQIDIYCYMNNLDEPKTEEEYIQYAARLQQVALINQVEFDEFVLQINSISLGVTI